MRSAFPEASGKPAATNTAIHCPCFDRVGCDRRRLRHGGPPTLQPVAGEVPNGCLLTAGGRRRRSRRKQQARMPSVMLPPTGRIRNGKINETLDPQCRQGVPSPNVWSGLAQDRARMAGTRRVPSAPRQPRPPRLARACCPVQPGSRSRTRPALPFCVASLPEGSLQNFARSSRSDP